MYESRNGMNEDRVVYAIQVGNKSLDKGKNEGKPTLRFVMRSHMW